MKKKTEKQGDGGKNKEILKGFSLRKFNTIYMMRYISSYLPLKAFAEGPKIKK